MARISRDDPDRPTTAWGARILEREGLFVGLIFALMFVLLALVVGVLIGLTALDVDVPDSAIAWGTATAMILPITIAAVLGFGTVGGSDRGPGWFGWGVGLLFGAGFELAAVGSLTDRRLMWLGVVLLVVTTAAVWARGWQRGWAMRLGHPGLGQGRVVQRKRSSGGNRRRP